ncbi:MAG: EAL domain-containing protein [Alphaproteobacteria bacterium]|nr:MAG: EAL domain-containing protein [Alphaproteobacteria bacterium]
MLKKAEKTKNFVAYAFCVGDVFLALDRELRIRDMEGALSWLGLAENGDTPAGRPLTEFMGEEDARLFRSTAALLGKTPRLGPLTLALGPAGRRQPVALFLAAMDPKSDLIHVVVMSEARLDGPHARTSPPLADSEELLDRLPSLLKQHGDDQVVVTLLELAAPADEAGKRDFARHLAALSLGGQSAAELSEGRYAVVHETGEGPCDAEEMMRTLEERTGQKLSAASLPAGELVEADDSDSVRALVYAVRKFAEDSPEFDIQQIGTGFSRRMKETREQIAMIRRIVGSRRFEIAWQPIVRLTDRSMHHVEALVRFDMRGGSPFKLISFAEQVGMIGEFDQAIIAGVTKRMRRLKRQGKAIKAAVNLSPASLARPAFVAWLKCLLEEHSMLVGDLLVEITESSHVTDLDALAEQLAMIRGLGFAVCLDDFGAGLSGFQYLRQLKVDYVKIDGSYVRDAEKDPEARAFLHAMVTLCRDLKVRTVAEWVETEAQAELLCELGVDFGQGFLFGAPRIGLPKDGASPARRRTG